ncbi:helix-turn-helix domain-containing protein [Butyrivibrio sp. FC2001]|uniref:helix-turn-helix domain-containing protein n=1 Tax=Butyrivibrio sp. FC2001 TaxID=1280671 RepID=UPI0004157272|nr:helix-turn-helix domain-containing protein [Butyrivibrio sp. FC2001]
MARTKGAKNKGKVKFSSLMLKQAMSYKGKSIRKLGDDSAIKATEKTLRTYIKNQEMPEETLDKICEILDVDINLVKGKYNRDFSKMSANERYLFFLAHNPKRLPYMKQKERENKNGAYLESVLTGHGISMKQYEALNDYDQLCMEIALEDRIGSVLEKYFDELANGDDIQEIYSWWMQLVTYRDNNYDSEGNKIPPIADEDIDFEYWDEE